MFTGRQSAANKRKRDVRVRAKANMSLHTYGKAKRSKFKKK